MLVIWETKLWIALLVFLLSCCKGLADNLCQSCNCQISSRQGSTEVRTLTLICNSGTVTWHGASGAIRLKLSPLIRDNFRFCFVTENDNTHLKISQESLQLQHQNYRLNKNVKRTLTLNPIMIAHGKSKEYCIDASNKEDFLLFLEPVSSPHHIGVPKVVMHYEMEPPVDHSLDPMEDCRPCTKEEILDAYCSMDFVGVGRFTHVSDDETDDDKSLLTLSISQVIHQTDNNILYRVKRSERHLTGRMRVARHCKVTPSKEDFLITGKRRLGELSLHCAPYLHEWRDLREFAECSYG